MQFGVNYVSQFLLTNLLLDTLKNSAPSRVVLVASGLHKKGKMEFAQDDLIEGAYLPVGAYG